MLKIRKQIFETNSSSSHSITIDESNSLYHQYELPEEITIGTGEYYQGFELIDNFYVKLDYLALYIKYCDDHYNKKYKSEKKKMLIKVLKEMTDVKVIKFSETGCIDHQSTNKASSVFETETTLKDFLFKPTSLLIIDGD